MSPIIERRPRHSITSSDFGNSGSFVKQDGPSFVSKSTVSVVIPAINEAANINAAVKSADNAGAFEVIVVDGGSTDQTRKIAESAGARVILTSPGRAKQQNAGAAAATGSVLLFMHADCRLGANCILDIQTALSQNSNGATFGAFRQLIDASTPIFRWIEWGNGLRVSWFSLPFGDQGIWLTRELFQQVGQFANVRIMEDVILSERLRAHGRPILLAGPLHVGARRWQQVGPIRQTLRNWKLLARYKIGIPLTDLAESYPRHDS